MRPLPPGHEAKHSLTVRDDMTVDFEGDAAGLGKLHGLYATYWLVKHVELVSRKLLLPFLEPGEDGLGFEVAVRHLAPTLPGMRVDLVSRYLRTEGNRIYAAVTAWNELGDRIGEGTTTQVVLPKARLVATFSALLERWRAT